MVNNHWLVVWNHGILYNFMTSPMSLGWWSNLMNSIIFQGVGQPPTSHHIPFISPFNATAIRCSMGDRRTTPAMATMPRKSVAPAAAAQWKRGTCPLLRRTEYSATPLRAVPKKKWFPLLKNGGFLNVTSLEWLGFGEFSQHRRKNQHDPTGMVPLGDFWRGLDP